jgi:hypothetical protein
MLLPHHFSEGARAVFAGQDKVGHAAILSGVRWRPLHGQSPQA